MSCERVLDDILKHATMPQIEGMIEDVVAAAPNLFVVARGLRQALEGWERVEIAQLLWDLLGPDGMGKIRIEEIGE